MLDRSTAQINVYPSSPSKTAANRPPTHSVAAAKRSSPENDDNSDLQTTTFPWLAQSGTAVKYVLGKRGHSQSLASLSRSRLVPAVGATELDGESVGVFEGFGLGSKLGLSEGCGLGSKLGLSVGVDDG